jgi:uncharacterized membrane protein
LFAADHDAGSARCHIGAVGNDIGTDEELVDGASRIGVAGSGGIPMLARTQIIWDDLRNSLWALPMAIVLVAAVVAVVTLQLRLPSMGSGVWWLYSGDASQASDLLANLLGAMITMSTLAISITIVVLTLAAQSLGPRLIQIFMGNTGTKLALGLFVGTVVYLLLVLRTIVGTSSLSVPQLAVTLSTVLVIGSIVVLLFFVHHLARSIVADTIIRQVGDALDHSIARLLPDHRETSMLDLAGEIASEGGEPIVSQQTGYVQAIDRRALISTARSANGVIALRNRPGHYVIAGDTLGWLRRASGVDDNALRDARNSLIIGSGPTPVQDIEYSIRQLVEIALRALSPGINDPFTANAVIDRMAGSIGAIMQRGLGPEVLFDEDGELRVMQPTTTFDGMVDASFNQIRQMGASNPAILIRLADRLGQLVVNAPDACVPTLARHLDLVESTAVDAITHQADCIAIKDRVEAARAPVATASGIH